MQQGALTVSDRISCVQTNCCTRHLHAASSLAAWLTCFVAACTACNQSVTLTCSVGQRRQRTLTFCSPTLPLDVDAVNFSGGLHFICPHSLHVVRSLRWAPSCRPLFLSMRPDLPHLFSSCLGHTLCPRSHSQPFVSSRDPDDAFGAGSQSYPAFFLVLSALVTPAILLHGRGFSCLFPLTLRGLWRAASFACRSFWAGRHPLSWRSSSFSSSLCCTRCESLQLF